MEAPRLTIITAQIFRLLNFRMSFQKTGVWQLSITVDDNYAKTIIINLYEFHWQKFVAFRQWKGINVFNVRSQLFYQYLVDIFEDNTAPSTMISHGISVGSVLKHWKYEPSTDLHVKVLRGMQLSGPVVHHTMRQWDLHLMLSALMCPPFVPAGSRPTDAHIDLKWWTLKTCFLVDDGDR